MDPSVWVELCGTFFMESWPIFPSSRTSAASRSSLLVCLMLNGLCLGTLALADVQRLLLLAVLLQRLGPDQQLQDGGGAVYIRHGQVCQGRRSCDPGIAPSYCLLQSIEQCPEFYIIAIHTSYMK